MAQVLLCVLLILSFNEDDLVVKADALTENNFISTLILSAIITAIFSYINYYRISKEGIVAFANLNNLKIIKNNTNEKLPLGLSYGFNTSLYSRSDILQIELENSEWDIFTLHNNSKNFLKFTIFRTPIRKDIPMIVLDSHDPRGNISLPHSWHSVELEGDFNKYFSLFLPKGKQIDVLSYISPDLMQLVKEDSHLGDVEITDGCLYIIANEDVINHQRLPVYLGRLDAIKTYISNHHS